MMHSLIVDDWLYDFDGWRRWADGLDYEDALNPADGVLYPGIYRDVPRWGIRQRLAPLFGQVQINALFLRLSMAGVSVPHQAHNDALMGRYSLMVYMNRSEHCQGGTSLVRHVDGDISQEVWQRDTNITEQWRVTSMCDMQPNRAFIFRADLMHRAEPIAGFGANATDGRLVMTCFFDA